MTDPVARVTERASDMGEMERVDAELKAMCEEALRRRGEFVGGSEPAHYFRSVALTLATHILSRLTSTGRDGVDPLDRLLARVSDSKMVSAVMDSNYVRGWNDCVECVEAGIRALKSAPVVVE